MNSIANRMNFTATAIAGLTCPPSGRPDGGGRAWFYDTKVPGLALAVMEGGGKVYYLYKWLSGKPKRIRIGTTQELTVEQARRRAGELNSQIAQGIDPQAEKRRARAKGATVADLWGSYLAGHLAQKKTAHWYERLYALHLSSWASRPIAEITTADIERLRLRVGKDHGVYVANRLVELVRAMYRSRGHLFGLPRHYTPTAGVGRFDEQARDRVLKPEELSRFMAALSQDPNEVVRDYFMMLLVTGQRKKNAATMTWQDVSLQRKEWRIPGMKTKNGEAMIVPLVKDAVAILERREKSNPPDSPFVFPGCRMTPEQVATIRMLRGGGKTTREVGEAVGLSQTAVMRALKPGAETAEPRPFNGTRRAWERLLQAAGIDERTTIHDLRRTFCTALIEAGVSLPYVSAAMGHRDMDTTRRHYAIARQDAVRKGVEAGVAGLMAVVAVGVPQPKQETNAAKTA